jgi:hypothetical protein
VGTPGAERQISNVANGTSPTDAANMRQLDASSALNETRVYRTGALAAALTGIMPLAYDANARTQFGIGLGGYHNESAIAIGVNHYISQSVLINAGMAINGSETMWRGGLTFLLGKATKKTTATADAVEVDTLRSQLQQQQTEVQLLKQQVSTLIADRNNNEGNNYKK